MVSAACVRLMSLASLAFEALPQRAGLLVLGQSESEAMVAVVRLSYRVVVFERARVIRLGQKPFACPVYRARRWRCALSKRQTHQPRGMRYIR